MDTHEPEFRIKSINTVGGVKEFMTEIGGYYGIFRYDIKEVHAIRPVGANAYEIIGEPEIIRNGGNPTHHRAKVQFYSAEVDATQRLIRTKTLENDFNTLMMLLEKERQEA